MLMQEPMSEAANAVLGHVSSMVYECMAEYVRTYKYSAQWKMKDLEVCTYTVYDLPLSAFLVSLDSFHLCLIFGKT